MAAKNKIMGQLNSKKVELQRDAEASASQAEYYEQQAIVLKGAAELSQKQVKAVEEAFGILTRAGIEF